MSNIIYKLISDYTIIDLETTTKIQTKAKIVEISIIKVRDNKIIESFNQLINPKCKIPPSATNKNHITDEMVVGKPTIVEVEEKILEMIKDEILLGHNLSYDINVLSNELKDTLNEKKLDNKYIDTMQFARKAIKGLDNYKLDFLVEKLNFTKNTHRAYDDCISTKELYDYIKNEIETKNLHYLLDNDDYYEEYFEENYYNNSSKKTYNNVKSKDLVANAENKNENSIFFDKYVCFTGDLNELSRKDAFQFILDLGGHISDNVTKKTDFLVISEDALYKPPTGKYKKAEEYISKGQNIKIIIEKEFMKIYKKDKIW